MKKLNTLLKSAGVQVNSQPVGNTNTISVTPITGKVQQNVECWNIACANGSC